MSISNFLDMVMGCDPYVRFAVVVDKDGNKIDSRIKDGIENFLPSKEMDLSIKHAENSWKFRQSISGFLGKNQYVIAVYDNVKRVVFPLGNKYLLLVALDNHGGQKNIVERIQALIKGDYTVPITPGPQH